MKKSVSFPGTAITALVILAFLVILPVSGQVYQSTATHSLDTNGTGAGLTGVTATTTPAHSVSATISSEIPVVGEPVTISGTVTGKAPPSNVHIWVFAGSYMNVTSVPLNSYGMFSKTLSTTELTPALYFVYIQSPGPNGEFDVDIENAGISSGQVINTRTNTTIFNITGMGSIQDSAASQALSDAIADQGFDDAYTKLTFQLTASGNTTVTMQTTSATPGTSVVPSETTTARSPLSLEITGLALVTGVLAVTIHGRKRN
jgi:hypothetical protein